MNMIIPVFVLSVFLTSCSNVKTDRGEEIIDKKTIGLLPTEKQPDLIELAEFKGMQVTGVAVTKEGRMFANFPRWRKEVPFSVVEIMKDGSYRPYPNQNWNHWDGKTQDNRFTCVQSILVHGNSLFVLDPSSPEMKGVLGKAKLYEFDLATNKLKRKWEFDKNVAPSNSYLNDFRIDGRTKKVFITDSGLGGIVLLDMVTGQTQRLLDEHPSTKSENITLTIEKKKFNTPVHSDGIALNPTNNKLYYHALTGYTLYRVPASELRTDVNNQDRLAEKVENLGATPAPDGMVFDKNGNLYMADLERNAISYRTPRGEMKILVQDEKIKWPDTLTIDGENNLIFTDSLLHQASVGSSVKGMSFKIYKVALPKENL